MAIITWPCLLGPLKIGPVSGIIGAVLPWSTVVDGHHINHIRYYS
jgi:hypothetical protein